MLSIRKKELDFLSGEIDTWLERSIIDSHQAERILALYEIRKRNLPMILLTAGGILLFLGLVSFIAAHWHELNKILRVCIISGAYILSLCAYFYTGKSQTKIGKSFLLLGSVIFGAGIYLIARMYDYKLSFSGVLGHWSIMIILTAILSRDTWQVYFAQLVALIWMHDVDAINSFALYFIRTARIPLSSFFAPMNAFVLLFALWLTWHLTRDRIALNLNMLLTLLLMASRMSLCLGGTLTLIILTLSGAFMSFMSNWHDAETLGLFMLGMFGMLLTWPDFWRGEMFESSRSFLAIFNAFFVAVMMLLNIYRGHFALGTSFCVMLASRYFFDHFFGYMPKAWGFTLTGVIFLFAGLYFVRKK